jgi:hypothetical protein
MISFGLRQGRQTERLTGRDMAIVFYYGCG